MNLKNIRHLMLGILIGAMVMMSAQGFAAQQGMTVSALLVNHFTIEFDGIAKALPKGYNILLYEGRTYVPARFIAEELGAEVGWNESEKTVEITLPKPEPKPEPKEDPAQEEVDSKSYKKLPITRRYQHMDITATAYIADGSDRRLFVSLENKSDIPIQLRQFEVEVVADGQAYPMSEVNVFRMDARWFNDVRGDETLEGYIALPSSIPKDAEKMSLRIPVKNNDALGVQTVVEFDISL